MLIGFKAISKIKLHVLLNIFSHLSQVVVLFRQRCTLMSQEIFLYDIDNKLLINNKKMNGMINKCNFTTINYTQ